MAQKEKTPEQKAKIASNAKAYYQANKEKCIAAKLKWIANQGFKNENDYVKQAPYYQAKLKNNQPNKHKKLFDELPVKAKAIPNMSNYYATPVGEIWTYSSKRKCYLQITQQTQKTGYKVFQPYISGKRVVRFVHIVMMETFVSPRPLGMQVDHIDHVRDNNKIENLQWITVSENLKRRLPYKRSK
jgi:hypothetical protein